jgi:quaternary ammonium compound-resistance protein SugE
VRTLNGVDDSGGSHEADAMKGWTALFIAALLEIVWASALKSTNGFTRIWPTAGVVGAMGASLYLLAVAARSLPIGTAYAVWTGIGAAGTALVAIFWGGESASAWRLVCIGLIVIGVLGLRYGS